MIITITATEKLTDINGVNVRHWKGITEKGIECDVFVHCIAVHNDEDHSQFEKELQEKMPSNDRTVSLRQIL